MRKSWGSRKSLKTCLRRVPEGLEDVSKYANLFSSLYGSGNWTLLDLKKLAGLNFLRVWREVEKVRRCFELRDDMYSLERWVEA